MPTRRCREEVWADDVDTWMASPYAPQGVAKPVDGGYIFNGRWQFSSGTDHCDWIILGAMLGDDEGKPLMPPQMLHMILPRKDYEIVEDSWNVVGLRGTGSKDVIVKDAFVPTYRTMDATKVMDGTAQREAGMTEPLYLMPWSTMFPLGISVGDHRHRRGSAGRAPGLPARPRRRHRHRDQGRPVRACTRSARRPPTSTPPARNCWPTSTASTTWSTPARRSSFADRAAGRRTQVRAVWRAVSAVDQIFARSGGNALRMDKPLQRYWRDAHAGLAHAIHVPGTTYHASALSSLGVDPPEGPLRAHDLGERHR